MAHCWETPMFPIHGCRLTWVCGRKKRMQHKNEYIESLIIIVYNFMIKHSAPEKSALGSTTHTLMFGHISSTRVETHGWVSAHIEHMAIYQVIGLNVPLLSYLSTICSRKHRRIRFLPTSKARAVDNDNNDNEWWRRQQQQETNVPTTQT